jgi:hypothetical protein
MPPVPNHPEKRTDMSPISRCLPALAAAAALGAAAPLAMAGSQGSDGAILINQAKVDLGGISPGDGAGFPVTLSKPGLYRLTGNLVVTDMARTAIVISSPGVTLDLNGFEISGPNTCSGSGAALSCASMSLPANAVRGHGVNVSVGSDSPASVVIANGSLRGFAGQGLIASGNRYNFTARRLSVSHMGYYGVRGAAGVVDSTLDRNVSGGIDDSAGVMHNRLMSNRGAGVTTSLARFNASWSNGEADAGNAAFE